MNNAKPQKITIHQQKQIEYWTEAKKGKFTKYLIQIAMHPVGTRTGGNLDKEDPIDQIVISNNLPTNEKIIINNKEYTSTYQHPPPLSNCLQ